VNGGRDQDRGGNIFGVLDPAIVIADDVCMVKPSQSTDLVKDLAGFQSEAVESTEVAGRETDLFQSVARLVDVLAPNGTDPVAVE